jgi:N-acetylgalactosamine 4-sulfate 6-O-sulfotransferase
MQVIIPAVLRATQPEMKLIVIMRDPVQRMHSAYWYYGCMYGVHSKDGLSPEGFDTVAQSELSAMNKCLDSHKSIRRCARELFHTAQQLVKGIYAAFVPDWLAVYPRDQIMWIRAEDYYVNERAHLQAWPTYPLFLSENQMVLASRGPSTLHACTVHLCTRQHTKEHNRTIKGLL